MSILAESVAIGDQRLLFHTWYRHPNYPNRMIQIAYPTVQGGGIMAVPMGLLHERACDADGQWCWRAYRWIGLDEWDAKMMSVLL
jgi:hypothetical protein